MIRNLVHQPLGAWYRCVSAKKILTTRPVACGADTSFELHTLTCEHDLLNTLWSLKTWYYFSATPPPCIRNGRTVSSMDHKVAQLTAIRRYVESPLWGKLLFRIRELLKRTLRRMRKIF